MNIIALCCVVLFLPCGQNVCAQLEDRLFLEDYRIDSLNKEKLFLELDNLSFFKNNEFHSTVQKGYTLPGFWLQLKAVYNPLSNLKIEGGVHSIWFFGTTRYPAFAYKGIAEWNGQDFSHNVHVLPLFRANLALSDNVSIILGKLYGGSSHRLIEPLYNPELNLTSDPENGLQLLYKTKWLDLDTWVDWMTYIYNLDTQQESFVVGASARFKLNSPDSRVHVYFPVQGLTQHKGGEIDITDYKVQTVMNGAVGAGFVWNVNNCILKRINMEFDILGYDFPRGNTFDIARGKGYYTKTGMQIKDFHLSTSYWSGKDFVPIFGSPFYGAISVKEKNTLYKNPKMFQFGADYIHPLSKGFAFGINADVHYYLPGERYSLQNGERLYSPLRHSINYSIGVYMRINPSFLIKQF